MVENTEFCTNCGNSIEQCRCEERTRHKRLLIFGIGSIAIGIIGYIIAFVI